MVLWKKMRDRLVERRPRIARRIMLSVISLLMKTKITPKLEAERRSKRRTYRRVRASEHWHGCAKEWICSGRLLAPVASFINDKWENPTSRKEREKGTRRSALGFSQDHFGVPVIFGIIKIRGKLMPSLHDTRCPTCGVKRSPVYTTMATRCTMSLVGNWHTLLGTIHLAASATN